MQQVHMGESTCSHQPQWETSLVAWNQEDPEGFASVGFPGSSVGKESTCNAGDAGSIPGSGRSGGEG